MIFNHLYPYTDAHELNLDWILRKMRQLGIEMDQFKALNTITFSGVWDITHQYPAWTVVNDNNLGYISIRPVPAGITISNTDYWASIVDYSAELAGIHSDIANLQNDVADINAELAKGKWVFFGDSYQNFGSWYDRARGVLGLTNNVNAFYAGASGHGFTVTGGEWETDFNTFIAGRTDLADFKGVVVAGGLNDSTPTAVANDGAVLRPAIDSFCAAVRAAMPNVKIYIAYIGSGMADSADLAGRTYENRIEAIRLYESQGVYNSCYILKNAEYAMFSYTDFNADGIHPTIDAGLRIGQYIAEAIMNGSAHVVGINKRTGDTLFWTGKFRAYLGIESLVDNNKSQLSMEMVVCTSVDTAFTIDNNYLDIGEIPYWCFLRNTKAYKCTGVRSDNSTADVIHLKVKIENRHMYIATDEMTNKNTFKTLTVNAGDRFDLGDLFFIEDTLTTM